MGRADARSAGIDSSEGVALSFHFSVYKVEPSEAVLARNLLANDDCRAALADEPSELRPEMAGVGGAASGSGGGEGLAGAGSCPDFAVVWPARKAKRIGPDPDTGKEMGLPVTGEIGWFNHCDRAFIDITVRYVPSLDQFAQPRRSERIDLVVVCAAFHVSHHVLSR